ncbi:unnamed protein product, partial [Prorocentrum cordatum]
ARAGSCADQPFWCELVECSVSGTAEFCPCSCLTSTVTRTGTTTSQSMMVTTTGSTACADEAWCQVADCSIATTEQFCPCRCPFTKSTTLSSTSSSLTGTSTTVSSTTATTSITATWTVSTATRATSVTVTSTSMAITSVSSTSSVAAPSASVSGTTLAAPTAASTSAPDSTAGAAGTGWAEPTLVLHGMLALQVSGDPGEFARHPNVLPPLRETIAAKAGSGTLQEDVEVWVTQPSQRLATAPASQRVAAPPQVGSRRASSMEALHVVFNITIAAEAAGAMLARLEAESAESFAAAFSDHLQASDLHFTVAGAGGSMNFWVSAADAAAAERLAGDQKQASAVALAAALGASASAVGCACLIVVRLRGAWRKAVLKDRGGTLVAAFGSPSKQRGTRHGQRAACRPLGAAALSPSAGLAGGDRSLNAVVPVHVPDEAPGAAPLGGPPRGDSLKAPAGGDGRLDADSHPCSLGDGAAPPRGPPCGESPKAPSSQHSSESTGDSSGDAAHEVDSSGGNSDDPCDSHALSRTLGSVQTRRGDSASSSGDSALDGEGGCSRADDPHAGQLQLDQGHSSDSAVAGSDYLGDPPCCVAVPGPAGSGSAADLCGSALSHSVVGGSGRNSSSSSSSSSSDSDSADLGGPTLEPRATARTEEAISTFSVSADVVAKGLEAVTLEIQALRVVVDGFLAPQADLANL